jgi:alanine racemase
MKKPLPHPESNQWAVIRPAAIRRNIAELRRLIPEETALAAVVKSDGYGHGILTAARAALDAGARFLVVIDVLEAQTLRDDGIDQDIMVVGPIPERHADRVVGLGLTPCVGGLESARSLDDAAKRQNVVLKTHLKVDTGMGRFGFSCRTESFHAALDELGKLRHLKLDGIATHFSEADAPESEFTAEQSRLFRLCVRQLTDRGPRPTWIHAANSGAIVHFPDTAFSLVRAGIAIYGAHPGPRTSKKPRLEPAMTLCARVADIRELPAGSPISYGRTFTTSRPSRLALLPMGYGHGYPRAASGRGACVVIRGKSAPLLGRVTMNLVIADVTDIPKAQIGDVGLFFGHWGADSLPVETLAEQAGTISYEILCNAGRCTPRLVEEE